MSDQTNDGPAPGHVPEIQAISTEDIWEALRLGWQDFARAPSFGFFFSAVYVVGGMAMVYILAITGKTWAVLPIALGFPLIGPFAAVGLYEVSRRLQKGEPLNWGEILGVVFREKDRQMPSIAAIILIFFLFWNFLAHMIFALFMGLSVMTNVTSTFDVYLTSNGLTMLAVGSIVGGILAFLLFSITVICLPLLLDREVDFVTAMITSFNAVLQNIFPMMIWAAVIVVLLVIGMLPAFLGLLVVLPLLGHSTWHLYQRVLKDS